jgi:hypothetical protein
MKKTYLIFFLFLTFLGCDKKFNNVVDTALNAYQVKEVSSFTDVDFNTSDSSKIFKLELSGSTEGLVVTYSVYSSDGENILSGQMYDNGSGANGDDAKGDGIFSCKLLFKQAYPNGIYRIEYFISNNSSVKKVAVHAFNYNNHQNNQPPVITNFIMPDSAADRTPFSFHVNVSDANGLSDIKGVYFFAYKADGSIMSNGAGDTLFSLHDDGNLADFGDQVAGDGVYTYLITFVDAAKGTRKFLVFAKDRNGASSDTLIHYIKVL